MLFETFFKHNFKWQGESVLKYIKKINCNKLLLLATLFTMLTRSNGCWQIGKCMIFVRKGVSWCNVILLLSHDKIFYFHTHYSLHQGCMLFKKIWEHMLCSLKLTIITTSLEIFVGSWSLQLNNKKWKEGGKDACLLICLCVILKTHTLFLIMLIVGFD